MIEVTDGKYNCAVPAVLPDGRPCPDLLTEKELIEFLRIPQISKATDHHNVISHLKRFHDLPRIHICGQPLYPLEALRLWIRDKAQKESQ